MNESLVQELYRSSSELVRGRFGSDVAKAVEHSRRYVDFVAAHAPAPGCRVLDVGCGGGWSTWLLRQKGFQAEGMDLHSDALEARSADPALPYTQGDATRMPFQDGLFDAVSMHAVLEHVPDPAKALGEAARVLRSGGRIIVAGPNLLSFPLNAYWTVRQTISDLSRGRVWVQRTPEMPRHPGGNTGPEGLLFTIHHAWHTLRKTLIERNMPRFLMRIPDAKPPFHADNDACYFCNPLDLVNWARSRGDMTVLQSWADDRKGARFYWPLAGGTWVVLQKR